MLESQLVRSLSLIFAVVLLAGEARGGNDYTFLVGARAAGMGGAYAAMSEEASTAWHNPAGLGFNQRYSIDVTASVFFLQLLRVGSLLTTHLPSGDLGADFDTASFQVVPTSLTYVYSLQGRDAGGESNHPVRQSLALSVIVPQAQKFDKSVSTNTSDVTGQGVAFDYHSRISLEMVRTRYFIGPSWGIAFADRFAVGASLFLVYGQSAARGGFNVDAVYPNAAGNAVHDFSLVESRAAMTNLGAALVAGVQWRPVHRLRLGLTVRPPGVWFYRAVTGNSMEASAVGQERAFSDTEPAGSPWGLGMATPFSLTLGIAFAEPGRFAVAVDGDWAAPHKDSKAGIRRGHCFNGRVGTEIYLSERWLLSFGAYTDLSADPTPEDLAETRMHFFGATAAVTVMTPYAVTGSEKTDRITFSNTFGLKYAYGYGEVGGFEYTPLADEPLKFRRKAASSHEISAIVGASVLF